MKDRNNLLQWQLQLLQGGTITRRLRQGECAGEDEACGLYCRDRPVV